MPRVKKEQQFKRLFLEPKEWKAALANLEENRCSFVVENDKCIWHNNERIYCGDNVFRKKEGKYFALIGHVHRNIANFVEKERNIPVEKDSYNNVFRNIKVWSTIPDGTPLDYIDINHAYWQIAHKYGYLSDKVYKLGLGTPERKHYGHIAIGTLKKTRFKRYYENGKLMRTVHDEKSERYEQIHNNIRNYCHNTMGMISDVLKNNCYRYYSDSMLFKLDAKIFKKVEKILKDRMDLTYKHFPARKINSKVFEVINTEGQPERKRF